MRSFLTGTIAAIVIAVVAFSLLVLGYDDIWGYKGRPAWITTARSYELVDAGSRTLSDVLAERRARLRGEETADTE